MNFLELCQMTARESGTVPGTNPLSVVNQKGRLLNVVEWVRNAWIDIQRSRPSWQFMRAEYTGEITQNTSRYSAQSFGIQRFSHWHVSDSDIITIYDPGQGLWDESRLLPIPWDLFRFWYTIGYQDQGRPTSVSVSPAGELSFGTTPDKTYIIRGEYQKAPQVLENNQDVPDLPSQYHSIIAWRAMMYVGEHDEGATAMAVAMSRYRQALFELERDYLPKMTMTREIFA